MTPPQVPPPTPPQRILVRGVNWLGDAVLSTPALIRLREARPQARITLLTHAKLADLWRHHSAVDELLTFAPGENVWTVATRLRAANFELALVLPNSPRSALEVWLAGIPQRIGYARPWRRWLLTHPIGERPDGVPMRKRSAAEINRLIRRRPAAPPVPLPPAAHHLYQYLHLVAALGGNPQPLPPRLELSNAEVAGARERFGLDPAVKWLGLNPGAEYGPAKRWPPEKFIAVTREMIGWRRWGVVIVGGPAEVVLATQIAAPLSGLTLRNLAGKTTLRDLCAVLKLCRVLLTNDTGAMHVAAAVGTPVVALFGSTAPELTGPGLPGDPRHQLLRWSVPCAPCFRRVCPIDVRCLAGIDVERVVEAVRSAAQAAPLS